MRPISGILPIFSSDVWWPWHWLVSIGHWPHESRTAVKSGWEKGSINLCRWTGPKVRRENPIFLTCNSCSSYQSVHVDAVHMQFTCHIHGIHGIGLIRLIARSGSVQLLKPQWPGKGERLRQDAWGTASSTPIRCPQLDPIGLLGSRLLQGSHFHIFHLLPSHSTVLKSPDFWNTCDWIFGYVQLVCSS